MVPGGVGLVSVVDIVAVLVGGSVSSSSNLTLRRLSKVSPMAALSNTSASVRVDCRTSAMSRVGPGGGTVGQVTTAVGIVAVVGG